jgi:hypothetical protein
MPLHLEPRGLPVAGTDSSGKICLAHTQLLAEPSQSCVVIVRNDRQRCTCRTMSFETAEVALRREFGNESEKAGAPGRTRTCDPRLRSAVIVRALSN